MILRIGNATCDLVLTSVLCERLKPHAKPLLGSYQCGFRPGKSTIIQIFKLRQIMENTHKTQHKTHHIFVDFKAAFDSLVRDRVYAAISELGIPAKLIRLCRMTLTSSIERASGKMGLAVNEGKTKYMLSTDPSRVSYMV